MNLKIRQAAIDDYVEVSKLTFEVHKLHLDSRPDVYLDIENPFAKEQYYEILENKDARIYVIENSEDKELLAYSIIKFMRTLNIPVIQPRKFAYIDDFCVKSLYKKNGIGRMLFEHLVAYAKSEGATSLQLNVWEFNENAIKFYEAMGMNTRNRRMELQL